ncbi:13071_t:CDS:2 [Acaulospora morrowiae]|uniref:13071_t:CDS:1 n=1 Tax=Acaulospora morrowiae TaxID=94023 RepID=A0A9N9FBD3_9GLOM|nr:13071_t:CDS:2 [Acaulospora morrowiae]
MTEVKKNTRSEKPRYYLPINSSLDISSVSMAGLESKIIEEQNNLVYE